MILRLKSWQRAGMMLVCLAVFTANAEASSVSGEVYAHPGSLGATSQILGPMSGTVLSDSIQLTGAFLETCSAEYVVDVANGTIKTKAYGHSSGGSGPAGSVPAAGQAIARFQETLDFTVPAGSYPTGVYVDVIGHMAGTIDISVDGFRLPSNGGTSGTGVNGYYRGDFKIEGTGPYTGGYAASGFMEDYLIPWDMAPFTLNQPVMFSHELVPAGETLASPLVLTRTVTVRAETVASAWSGMGEDVVNSNFFNTSAITALEVTEGVTWTSESGVFLNPSNNVIPEPHTMMGALLGFGGLARYVRKRRS